MNNISFETVQKTMEEMKKNPALKMKKWNAHISWNTGVQNQLKIRNFDSVKIDEPSPLGGTDTAPNPVEYLIGAAGSCFAITFEVMASQQGITLEEVEVDIEADLNAAVFLGIEEGDGGILNPVIKLRTISSASEEKILEIARLALTKSPVLLSLNTEVKLINQ